jgi:hypothetical protein
MSLSVCSRGHLSKANYEAVAVRGFPVFPWNLIINMEQNKCPRD